MSRVKQFDKENAIESALNLFWEKGYKATSLEELTYTIGIGKGSFYNTFKSKRALFDQCLTRYRESSIHSLKKLLNSEKDIKKGVSNFLAHNLNYSIAKPKQKGCYVTNSCIELANSDNEIMETISSHYQLMKYILIEYFTTNGKLQLQDARLKTDIILTFFIGLTVQLNLQVDKNQIISSIDKLIQSLL